MPGAPQCWRCHAPMVAQPYGPGSPYAYPAYAGRPARALNCTLITVLAMCFLCALGGLAVYFFWPQIQLWRQAGVSNPKAEIKDPSKVQLDKTSEQLLKGASDANSKLLGIQAGMSKSDVKEKLGEPLRQETGWVMDKKNDVPLTREMWVYSNGWVMFRYDTVVESGPNPPPFLNKTSVPVPGASGNFTGGSQ